MNVSSRRQNRGQAAHDEVPGGRTLTDDAYRAIRWSILTLQFEPGASFTEAELSERLGLSRTPLREALLLLRTEGFVTVEGRSGYRVSPITLRDVRDIGQVLRMIEGESAMVAATLMARADQLVSLAERVPPTVDESTAAAILNWLEVDTRFHIGLAAATGNRLLVDALQPVLGKYSRLVHLAVMLGTPAASLTHTHDDLMGALRNRDGLAAREAVVAQITRSEDVISRALLQSPSLLATNVVVEKASNAFYLDVKAALGDEDPNQSGRKGQQSSPKNQSRQGVTR